jgi:hypothetical protein
MNAELIRELVDAEYASYTKLPTAGPKDMADYHGNVLWAESYDYEVYRDMYNNTEQEPVGAHEDYSGYEETAYAAEVYNPGSGYEDEGWREAVEHMQEMLGAYVPENLLYNKDAALAAC